MSNEMKPEHFRAWRERLGFSQAEAAERLRFAQVTVQELQKWENGITPVPALISVLCERIERGRIHTTPEYGPVELVYNDAPSWLPVSGPARIPTEHREPWPTMRDAINRAVELSGSDNYHDARIVDNGNSIWTPLELAEECEKRRRSYASNSASRRMA